MSLKNEITISQEFEKDFKMAEFQMEEAIKYFFLLTERTFNHEGQMKIIPSLVRIIKKHHGDLTFPELGEAIENGCCEQYGEFTNFDEAIKLIPRFLKAFKKDKEENRRKEKSVIPLHEQEQNKIKNGEQVFKDHILLFVTGQKCFIEKNQLVIGENFCRSSFDAYINSMKQDAFFMDWFSTLR